ncbi:RIO-type serine/threonine-protein kinase Rio1 [Candidatus Bilamarchaeum dharawalense]|uniref:non-specific serine/threonine protein kinase n=1 Tax=Candidatus Bilamarchaeum dharawalense TaxID=2885759 RepID=A0A5E4LNR9_9ARCH|nr:RIO-type serine/threonine-protein kinase Rio1 [Candidatus Bilamarchaeum dharawalense]
MARRVSKRKKPLKEDYQLKERFKIESEVFDKNTLLDLYKLIKKEILKTVDYPISTGKEANVFRATTPDGTYVAVKIYKTETAPFFRKEEYLEADPRFSNIKDKDVVKAFARKEYKNLEMCESAGVHSPKPYYIINRVLVMGFLGEGDLPYPTLNMVGPLHGEADLDSLLEDIRKMYRAGLVHADLSEYNIMLGPQPFIIDFGQGVITRHPNAEKFLERDVAIILKYFAKFGIKRDLEKTLSWIRN